MTDKKEDSKFIDRREEEEEEEEMPKYKLTDDDIAFVLTGIRVYNRFPEIRESLEEFHREKLTKELKNITLFTKDQVPALKTQVENDFINSLVNPGESVGESAAISIGEPATQMILKSHQVVGREQKTVSKGVPRLKEIIKAKINISTPSTIIHFIEPITLEDIKYMDAEIPYITLKDIVKNSEVVADPSVEWWEKVFNYPFPDIPDGENKRWQLRLELNMEKCLKHRLTLEKIKVLIEKKLFRDIFVDAKEENIFHVTFSPMSIGIINIHINIDNIPSTDDEELDAIISVSKPRRIIYELILRNINNIHISGIKGITEIFPLEQRYSDLIKTWNGKIITLKPQIGLQVKNLVKVLTVVGYEIESYNDEKIIVRTSGSISSLSKRILYMSQLNKIKIDDNDDKDSISVELVEEKEGDIKFFTLLLKELGYDIGKEDIVEAKRGWILRSKNISDLLRYIPDMRNIDSINTKWAVQTTGNNLIEILALKGVDQTMTTSNSLVEIFKVFGVEEARNYIIEEISRIFGEFSTDPANIYMLADGMTHKGTLLKVSKAGINSREGGGLVSITFEGAMETIIEHSIFGVEENVKKTISGALITGNLPPIGSRLVDVFFDEDDLDNEIVDIPSKPNFKLVKNTREFNFVVPDKIIEEEQDRKEKAAAAIAELSDLKEELESIPEKEDDEGEGDEDREDIEKLIDEGLDDFLGNLKIKSPR